MHRTPSGNLLPQKDAKEERNAEMGQWKANDRSLRFTSNQQL